MEISNFAEFIIFDLDGVLINSAPVTRKAAKIALCEIGIDPDLVDFTPYIGTGEKNFISGPCKIFGKEDFIPCATENFYRLYRENLGEMEVFPSTLPLLRELAKLPVKIAIASSSTKEKLLASLSAAGIDPHWFDVIISGDDVAEKKPSPKIYLLAMKRLGATPERTLICEDAISGITAAKRAGAFCLAITTSFEKNELLSTEADHITDNIFDILNFVRKE